MTRMQEMAGQPRRRARAGRRTRGVDRCCPGTACSALVVAGRLWLLLTRYRPAGAGGGADRHFQPAAALGRVGGDRGRHRRRGRRAGGDAGDGRRLQGHAQPHRQRRQRDHPARRLAGRNQFGDHPRPGAADHQPGRHRARRRRPAAGVAGAVAGGEHGDQGRRHRCQRADARRRRHGLGAAAADARSSKAASSTPACANSWSARARSGSTSASTSASRSSSANQAVDRSSAPSPPAIRTIRNCGPTPKRWRHTYRRTAFQSVTVKLDGKDGFKQLKAAMAADPRLKLDVAHHARLLRQAVRRPDQVHQDPRHRDRHDHGDRCGVRCAQHNVRRGRRSRARDRDDARDRLPRPAGGGGGDAGDDAAGAARRPARRRDRLADVQRLQRSARWARTSAR